jgi:hypothetical protein
VTDAPLTSRWPRIRAGLLAFALLVHGIYALPLPKAVSLEDLRKDSGKENVDRWMGWFQGANLPIDRTWFEEEVASISGLIGGAHDALKWPFRPWMTFSGTGQSWALFAVPDRWPVRLEILVWRSGDDDWELAYRRLDPSHEVLAEQLAYRRLRGIYDGQIENPHAAYKNLTRWIARQIFLSESDVERVQVQGRKTHTTLPSEAPDPVDKVVTPRPHKRENHVPKSPSAQATSGAQPAAAESP